MYNTEGQHIILNYTLNRRQILGMKYMSRE